MAEPVCCAAMEGISELGGAPVLSRKVVGCGALWGAAVNG